MKTKAITSAVFASALVLGLSLITGLSMAYADEADSRNVASVKEEAAIKKIARSRSYVGGVDEEPLRVQSQLPTVVKDGQNEAEAPVDAD